MSCKAFARFGAGASGVLVLLLAPVAGAAASPSPSPAPPSAAISLRPLTVNPSHPSAYFTFHSPAGRSVSNTVLVTNPSNKPVTLLVSPVDGLTGVTTGAVYGNRGVPATKAGTWVSVSASTVRMAARSTRRVPFTVSVPAGASAGDHLAGIAFENAKPTTSGSNFRIREFVRNVIGVLVVVPGPAVFHPRLASLGIHEIGSTGIGSVLVGLGDDGLALGQPHLTVTLSGPKGYHRTLTRALDTVLPGDTVTYPYPWPDRLFKGTYNIKASLTGGGATVSMQRTVTLGTTLAGTKSPPLKAKSGSGIPLWVLFVVLGLAVVIGVGIGWGMRRRPGAAHARPDIDAAPAPRTEVLVGTATASASPANESDGPTV